MGDGSQLTIGLVVRNETLHIQIIPDFRYAENPSVEVEFALSWISENSTNPEGEKLKTGKFQSPSNKVKYYDLKITPPTETSTYQTKYILSYTLGGIEFLDYYPRTMGTEPLVDNDVVQTLYRFMMIPGWTNTKQNHSGGWTGAKVEDELKKLPRGAKLTLIPKLNLFGIRYGVFDIRMNNLFLKNKSYVVNVLSNNQLEFNHEPKGPLSTAKSTKPKQVFLENMKRNQLDKDIQGTLGKKKVGIEDLIDYGTSTVTLRGQPPKTLAEYLGGSGKWNIVNDVVANKRIGYGHLVLAGETFTGGLTDDQAKAKLLADVTTAVNHAKNLMGGNCWAGLDFWARVAWAELVLNIGQDKANTDKYLTFKTSLRTKNYGSALDTEATTSWGSFEREFTVQGSTHPCAKRHSFIKRYILSKLSIFKSLESEPAEFDVSNLLTTCTDATGGADPKLAYEPVCETEECEVVSSYEVGDASSILQEEVCVYNVTLNHASVEVVSFEIATSECNCVTDSLNKVVLRKYPDECSWGDGLIEFHFETETVLHELVEIITEDEYSVKVVKRL